MNKSELLCLEIMKRYIDTDNYYITSWLKYIEGKDFGLIPNYLTENKIYRALKAGESKGWIKSYWIKIGQTPYAGSAKRQRIYEITPQGKQAVKDR